MCGAARVRKTLTRISVRLRGLTSGLGIDIVGYRMF